MVDAARTPVVALLTRAPSSGGKSRLFAALGRPVDPDLLAALLLDTLDAVSAAGLSAAVVYTPEDAEGEIRRLVGGGVRLLPQRAGDLGARMRGAFDDLLAAGGRPVILVGSDLPTLDPRLINEAAGTLEAEPDSLVLGPANDGGYYLIGASRTPQAVLEGIEWGTAAVLDQTLDAARASGWTARLLDRWSDVDTADELRAVARTRIRARRTREWVGTNLGEE